MKIRNNLKAFINVIQLELSSTLRYRFSVFSDILVFSVLLAFFLMSKTGSTYASEYNYVNYKSMVLFGYLAWTLAITALTSSIGSISAELTRGTFYRKLQSPCNMMVLLFAELVSSILIELIVISVLILISRVFFDTKLAVTIVGIIAIIICTIGMFGIGLIVGGLTILFKRIGAITLLLEVGLLLMTDTIPTDKTLLLFTRIIPLTSCNAIIKYSLVNIPYVSEMLILLTSSTLWVLFGSFILKRCIQMAKRKGNLLLY